MTFLQVLHWLNTSVEIALGCVTNNCSIAYAFGSHHLADCNTSLAKQPWTSVGVLASATGDIVYDYFDGKIT